MTKLMDGRGSGAVVAMLMAVVLASCESPADVHDHTGPEVGAPSYQGVVASEFPALAKDVHAATARYHSRAQATRAGYAQASECVAALSISLRSSNPAGVFTRFNPMVTCPA